LGNLDPKFGRVGESDPEVIAAVLAMLRVVEYPVLYRIVWMMV